MQQQRINYTPKDQDGVRMTCTVVLQPVPAGGVTRQESSGSTALPTWLFTAAVLSSSHLIGSQQPCSLTINSLVVSWLTSSMDKWIIDGGEWWFSFSWQPKLHDGKCARNTSSNPWIMLRFQWDQFPQPSGNVNFYPLTSIWCLMGHVSTEGKLKSC